MHAHSPAQVIRHTAIVLAGAASIGFTGAAGAYIMSQMSDIQHAESAPPAAVRVPGEFTPKGAGSEPDTTHIRLISNNGPLPAFQQPPAPEPEPVAPQVASTTPSTPRGVAGTLRLGETAYVGAHVAPVRGNTFAITLDTNVFSTLSNILLSDPVREGLGAQEELAGVTRLRTELDTRAGVTLMFSDPVLGEHALQVNRNPAPAERVESSDPAASAAAAEQTPVANAGTITV
ncbi:hypothetical protein ACWDYH_26630 [Nocardia goodfellowii]